MYGFKPGAKPQGKAPQGKKIEGPGNGTSDSIKTDIPKGSYIMPADSTQQIGQKALGKLGQPVPVNVSNGEYQMPPEQVHAVGVQALNQMRDATHMPAPAGFKPQKDGLYFADGGSPAEEERKRLAGTGPSPQMGAVALGEQRRAERAGGSGLYSQANADLGRAASTAFPNTATAIRGAGQNIAEAYQVGGFPAAAGSTVRNTLVPAIGFAADVGRSAKQALDPFANALKTAVTGDPTPIEGSRSPAAQPAPAATTQATSTPTAPASAPAAQGARAGYGFTPDPMQGPAQGMRVSPTSAPEINRIDNAPGLKSPLFTNLPTGQAVSEMQGGTVNSFDMQAGNEAMARANAIRGGAETQATGFQPDRGGSGGVIASGADDDAQNRNEMFARWGVDSALFKAGIGKMGKRDAALLDARLKQYEAVANQGMRRREIASKEGQAAADRAALLDRTAMQESGANARSFSRDDIDRMRMGIEGQAKGFEVRGLERMEKLYSAYENAKTPEERAAAAEQIRVMNGKEAPNRFTVVPGGQEVTEQGLLRTVPSVVLNNQTGKPVDLGAAPRQGGAQATQRPVGTTSTVNGKTAVWDGSKWVPR